MKRTIYSILVGLTLVGCSGLKNTIKTTDGTTVPTADVKEQPNPEVPSQSKEQPVVVRRLPATATKMFEAQEKDIPSFNASRVIATMGKMSVNASARYLKDSALVVSVQFMGFEAARLEMTNQGLRGIDKLHKVYFESSYDELNKQYSVPFQLSNAIDLVLGRIFLLGSSNLEASNEAFSTLQSGTTKSGYAVYWTTGKVNQRFDADTNLTLTKTRLTRDAEEIYVLYSNWQNGSTSYPANIQLVSQGTNKASVSLAIQRISFETPQIQFQDLSRYKRITLDQLMNEYLK